MKRLEFSNAQEVRRSLARVANMVLNGELDVKSANAIVYASSVVLTSIRIDEQEQRLDELEQILADNKLIQRK